MFIVLINIHAGTAMTTPATNDNTEPMIFFDLDGVLSDFDRWAREQGKFTPDGKPKWDELDYNWWVSMPQCPGAKDAYDAAKKLGTVKFLTAATRKADSFSGKADWLKKFVPERGKTIVADLIITASADKYLVAAPNRILIDDRQANIDAWVAAGGIGIHHTGDFKVTLKQLADAVAKLKAATPAATPVAPKPPIAKIFNRAPRM
jgi:5'(3')-deoxyribonucleotidase